MKYAFTIFPPQIGVPPSFPAKFVHIYVYILYPPPSPPHKCSTKSALTATPPIPSNSTISIYVYTLFLSLFAKAPKPILRDVRYFSVRLIIVSAILRSRQRAASVAELAQRRSISLPRFPGVRIAENASASASFIT